MRHYGKNMNLPVEQPHSPSVPVKRHPIVLIENRKAFSEQQVKCLLISLLSQLEKRHNNNEMLLKLILLSPNLLN